MLTFTAFGSSLFASMRLHSGFSSLWSLKLGAQAVSRTEVALLNHRLWYFAGQMFVLRLAASPCHRYDRVVHESAFSPLLEERDDSSVIIDSCFECNEEQQSCSIPLWLHIICAVTWLEVSRGHFIAMLVLLNLLESSDDQACLFSVIQPSCHI